jgi:hypothetical protein
MNFDAPQVAGYFASICILATVSMRSMVPSRMLAILSSFAFLVYGIPLKLWPVVSLHAILLPLNVIRLREVLRMRELRAARDGLTSKRARPAMTRALK